ncbi:MAG: hypothetical protein N0E55_08630, partial [Candidatus Thiodiazotropha taylori]|nr:hypothetical protein [Candidatus Thiodiazotropha taylori]MCW4252757.1 hypothetical protein [Candidatus Thiodiazotropha taylori]
HEGFLNRKCNISEDDINYLQYDNDDLEEWREKWLLKYNFNKCCVLHYGHNSPNYTYHMHEKDEQKEIRTQGQI